MMGALLQALKAGASLFKKWLAQKALEKQLKDKDSIDVLVNVVFIITFIIFFIVLLCIICNPITTLVMAVVSFFVGIINSVLSFFGLSPIELDLVKQLKNSKEVMYIQEIQKNYGIKGFDYGDIDEIIDANEEEGDFDLDDYEYDGEYDFEVPDNTSNNKVPYISQNDSRWNSLSYGYSTYGSGGCCPTSMAMVLSYKLGEEISPVDVGNVLDSKYSNKSSYYLKGSGTFLSAIPTVYEAFGYECREITLSELKETLLSGNPVILNCARFNVYDERGVDITDSVSSDVKASEFTAGGHFVVITGIDNEGYYRVNDPNILHKDRSNRRYKLEDFKSGKKVKLKNGSYSISGGKCNGVRLLAIYGDNGNNILKNSNKNNGRFSYEKSENFVFEEMCVYDDKGSPFYFYAYLPNGNIEANDTVICFHGSFVFDRKNPFNNACMLAPLNVSSNNNYKVEHNLSPSCNLIIIENRSATKIHKNSSDINCIYKICQLPFVKKDTLTIMGHSAGTEVVCGLIKKFPNLFKYVVLFDGYVDYTIDCKGVVFVYNKNAVGSLEDTKKSGSGKYIIDYEVKGIDDRANGDSYGSNLSHNEIGYKYSEIFNSFGFSSFNELTRITKGLNNIYH